MRPELYKTLILDRRIHHGAFRLWHLLRDYRNHRTGLCCPALRTLAAKLGSGIVAVSKWRDELVQAGYITVTIGGPRRPSFYTFTEPEVMYSPEIHKPGVMLSPEIRSVSKSSTELNRLNEVKKEEEAEKILSFTLEEVRTAGKRLGMDDRACPGLHRYHSKRQWKGVADLDDAIRFWMESDEYRKYLDNPPAPVNGKPTGKRYTFKEAKWTKQ